MLTIPREGLVAEYYLNGDAVDVSGNGNDGTATDVTWVDTDIGYQSKCGSFNGSSSKITVSDDDLRQVGNITYSCYVKLENISDDSKMIVNVVDNGESLETNTLGYILIEKDTGQVKYGHEYGDGTNEKIDFNFYLDIGKWYYIAITRDTNSKTVKLYVNGKNVDTGTYNNNSEKASSDNTQELGIGYDKGDGGGGKYFKGRISLFRFYNRVLSEKEIQALYLEGLKKLNQENNTIPELFKGCVAYYDFRGGDLHNIRTGEKATNNGATLATDHLGYENNAYNFDGDSGIIDNIISQYHSYHNSGKEGLTYVIIYKSNSTDTDQVMIGGDKSSDNNDDFQIMYNYGQANRFRIYFKGGDGKEFSGYFDINNASDGNWHILSIYAKGNSGTNEIWFDGQQISSFTTEYNEGSNSYNDFNYSAIGSRNVYGSLSNGFIGDISIVTLFKGNINHKLLYNLLMK